MTYTRDQPATTIVDTLRMTDKDLQRVLAMLPMSSETSSRGGVSRMLLANLPRMLARIQARDTGGWITHVIKPREVHGQGMRFLFGAFVHEGVRCAVLLRDQDGKPVQLAGQVHTCRHLHGRIHEISAIFDRPISPENYQYPDGSPVAPERDGETVRR